MNNILYRELHTYGINSWHLGYKDQHLAVITKEMIDKFKIIYEKSKTNKLKPNSKVCFLINELPAYKVKPYLKENNISKIRKLEEADTVVVNLNFINKAYVNEAAYKQEETERYVIPNSIFKKFPLSNSSYDPKPDIFNDDYHFLLPKQGVQNFKTDQTLYNQIINCNLVKGKIITNYHGNAKAYTSFEDFVELIKGYDKYNVVFEENINNDLNKDLVIDNDIFNNLLNMLKSSDPENLKLAQELVANLDIETAKPYLYFLFWAFDKFKRVDNNGNFKFLLKQMTEISTYRGLPLASFLVKIIKDHPEYKQTIFECLAMYLNVIGKTEIIKEIKVS